MIIDFHGSTGYGQAFTDAISGDWGGKPLEDLQKGLDAALAEVRRGSTATAPARSARRYGGYMINWIAGNWPSRFKCLVNHDGIFDERDGLLRHRGAVVPRVGARRHAVGQPGGLREASTRSTT